MILVADSGSTNTDWVIIKNNKISFSFNTLGINPFFIGSKGVIAQLQSDIPKSISPNEISKIYFYGAGCSNLEMQNIIFNALNHFFPNAIIEVNSDILGAARALFFKKKGIAGILGTGSSTCFYDGDKIIKNITPLGYILGNEGGGDYLGKLLITDFLNDELPKNICEIFNSKHQLSKKNILNAIYKEPYPNRFLASFCKFISANSDNKYISEIIFKSFRNLFTKHICKYKNYNKFNLRFTGSIAFHFQKELKKIASDFNANIDTIEKRPIHKLAQYHIRFNDNED